MVENLKKECKWQEPGEALGRMKEMKLLLGLGRLGSKEAKHTHDGTFLI